MRTCLPGLTLVASLAVLTACSGSSQSSSPVPPPTNVAPVASAGPPQSVTTGALVTLDGSASTDSDGTIASYAWSQTGGTAVTLTGPTTVRPTFTAPVVAAPTPLTFSLTVTDNRGATSAPATVTITVNSLAAGTITGRVDFVRIPFNNNTNFGLNYANPQNQPARGVTVQAIDTANQAVRGTAVTEDDGDYSLNVSGTGSVTVRVVAEMVRTGSPSWDFSVQDLDNDDGTAKANPTRYFYDDTLAIDPAAGTVRDILVPSGFTNASGVATGTRASAPFAILDTFFQGVQLIRSAAANTNFPPLIADWEPSNTPEDGTFFTDAPPQHITLSGDTTADTDEFDQHVIAHEFGHYIENNFSRADTIGGPHTIGDKLDMRVAFGEGFGYAFAGMVLNDPVVRDSFVNSTLGCPNNQCSGVFNIETNPPSVSAGANYGCWCSESSVWSILWDLFDSAADTNDNLNLGFTPIWNVLVNAQKNTPAFTSIFTFITALKAQSNANVVTAIDTLVAAQNINSVQIDAFGSNENHFPNGVVGQIPSLAVLPIYTTQTVGGPQSALLTVDDGAALIENLGNKLGNRRFIRFTGNGLNVTITATSTNAASNSDVDFIVYRSQPFGLARSATSPPNPAGETTTMGTAIGAEYLIDVYDCAIGCVPPDQGSTQGDYTLSVRIQ